MTRLFAAAAFVVAFACSCAFASEPGQPLDLSDWVLVAPGHSWVDVVPYPGDENHDACRAGDGGTGVDARGGKLFITQEELPVACGNYGPLYRWSLKYALGATVNLIAYVDDRCVSPTGPHIYDVISASIGWMDLTSGRLMVGQGVSCGVTAGANCNYQGGCRLSAMTGFPTLFEVLQSYTPEPAAFGFRVPYMPEGMAGADHFDTYWGNLAHPLDFPQAHPLQSNYPAAPPHVGDYLTVADTVPTPAPGQGAYYVTSATYQGARRYGRKTTAGHLSGRDPAVLPVCGP